MNGIERARHLEGKRDRDRDSIDRSVRQVVIRYTDGSSPSNPSGFLEEDDAVEIADLFDKGSASMEFDAVNEQ